ncbi:MAG: hypothetical protein ABWX67_14530 [Allosphingosinicella sp.]
MRSRGYLQVAAGAALIAAAPAGAAEPAPSVAAYEAAMRDLDYRRAAREADLLASRHRLEHREMRPDPLLSGLFGRLFQRRGQPAAALPYLRHGDSPALPAPQRIAAGFARAEAEEALGDWTAAAATFERLLSLPLEAGQQSAARTGLARVRLADDPAAALALARPLAAGAPAGRRWEPELVSAQALSLLGKTAEAEAAASRAWADSLGAAAAEAAPSRVALVRAGLAAAAGAREPLLAMLSLANASLNAIDPAIASAAPLCGEGGVTPADHAIFAAYTRTDATQWLMPIAASRPAVAGVFRKAIAGQHLLDVTGTPPGGLVFTLRCRTEASADYAAPLAADPWIEWYADRGLYFIQWSGTELEDINRIANEIETLVARNGDDHPSIVPLRVGLLMLLEARASSATDVSEWQVAELRRKIGLALAKAGGTEGLRPDPEAEAELAQLAKAGALQQALAAYRAIREDQITRLPPRFAYAAFRQWGQEDTDLPDPVRRRIVEALLARIGGGPADPMRLALQRRLGHLAKKAGDSRASRAAFAAARLPSDSCGVMETAPVQQEHGMSDDDYPPDAIDPNIAGVSALELNLGADGRVVSGRTVLAAPSLLFDRVLEAKLPGFRYAPATEQGRARSCRGLQQSIKWRMPEEQILRPPVFAPAPDGET